MNRWISGLLPGAFLVALSACKGFGELDSTASPALQIQVDNQVASLQLGELKLQVDINFGGRITEFSLAGKNALVAEGKYTGSTFWTSPQSDWDWPPPAEIDSRPYAFEVVDDSLELISSSLTNGVRVEKSFSATDKKTGFKIRYTLRNLSEKNVRLAPWEVTRISGGYTFYPASGRYFRSSLATTDIDGVTWHYYQPAEIPEADTHKLYADGVEGWIANANPATGLLLVKSFPDINPPDFAPGEAEIEVYASPDKNYIEVEQQGSYATIPPMSAIDWTVTWYLQHIDSRYMAIGNSQLVKTARAIREAGNSL